MVKKKKRQPTAEEKNHMAKIAAMGCVLCGASAEVHHIRTGMGMGRRAGHFQTIPLCFFHHRGMRGIHALGRKRWEKEFRVTESGLLEKVMRDLALGKSYGFQ
jgi:hypothetical protein